MNGLLLYRVPHVVVRVLIAVCMAVFVAAHRHQQGAYRHRDDHQADELSVESGLGEPL